MDWQFIVLMYLLTYVGVRCNGLTLMIAGKVLQTICIALPFLTSFLSIPFLAEPHDSEFSGKQPPCAYMVLITLFKKDSSFKTRLNLI